MANIIRVQRLIQYEGDVDWVRKVLENSWLQLGIQKNCGSADSRHLNTIQILHDETHVMSVESQKPEERKTPHG